MTDLSMCPRAKRTVRFEGEFRFSELKVFTVGDAARFFRAIRVLCPDLPVAAAPRGTVNVNFTFSPSRSHSDTISPRRVMSDALTCDIRASTIGRNAIFSYPAAAGLIPAITEYIHSPTAP